MTLPRQKLRELVFEILFSYQFSSVEEEEILSFLMKEHSISKKNVKEALLIKQGIAKRLADVDLCIEKNSQEYEFERIPSVEKTILRMQIFDILYNEQIPGKVAISEGIRLAKKFSTSQGATFVNALLDVVYQSHAAAHHHA